MQPAEPHQPAPIRVAYTLEQCWHQVPGGTATAALRMVDELAQSPAVRIVAVAGRHRCEPPAAWRPSVPVQQLPLASPWLYQGWLWLRWPPVERATGDVDLAHATGLIPCATKAPLVVTVHDLAFLYEPRHFSRTGVYTFRRSLEVIRRRAAIVLCSSRVTLDDCMRAGIPHRRLRCVPLGVDSTPAAADAVAGVRAKYRLPDDFVLFVGTIEPRKNLSRLAAAVTRLPRRRQLVVVGADGWGDAAPAGGDIRFLGFVPDADLGALYAAATVVAYPSLREGYGLPVLEAMAQGAPVVTSMGTSTEEVAGGAAVLIDPYDVDDIARGLAEAERRRDELAEVGRRRAAGQTWARSAELTVAAYRDVVDR
jgi:glycosyltransferase involved in cell wall biosynthesis